MQPPASARREAFAFALLAGVRRPIRRAPRAAGAALLFIIIIYAHDARAMNRIAYNRETYPSYR